MSGDDAPTPDRERVARRVREAIRENEVVVFLNDDDGVPNCRFSRRALSLVARHREEYATVDVGAAPEAYRSVLADRTGWVTVPQVFVDGEFVGDGDVLADLEDRDRLASTLEAP